MRVLGLETSCDETAAAVLELEADAATPDRPCRVLGEAVHTQVALHAPYGGVVPELASRDHLARALPVVELALSRAGIDPSMIDLVAATRGPGLVGALLVGVQVGKALAWSLGRPFVGANHLLGHALSVHLGTDRPAFPYIALLVSGGHTALYAVESPAHMRCLGQTLDDAAGEAFDKVGKLLGLGYPAGALIDRLAGGGDRARWDFPRSLRLSGELDFSFSGVKTSLLHHVEKHGVPQGAALADVCASFQEAVCDVLVTRALQASARTGIRRVVLGGGVAANSRLRELLRSRASRAGVTVWAPAPALCTDNGAMIALAGYERFVAQGPDSLDVNAEAAWRP